MSTKNTSYNKVSEEQLLSYINGKLSAEEQYVIEQALENDPFLYDAIEGLSDMKNKENIALLTNQINLQLAKQINLKPKNKPIKFQQFSWYIAVFLVLIIAVLAWYVLHLMR